MSMSMILSLAPIRALGLAALVLAELHGAVLAQTPNTDPSGDTPFSSMAIARDEADACRVPKPPADLAESAYVRNGYRAILRILAAEKWEATGSCDCFLTQITWEEVKENSDRFTTADDPVRRFNVSELRVRADELSAQRGEACQN